MMNDECGMMNITANQALDHESFIISLSSFHREGVRAPLIARHHGGAVDHWRVI
jgi:hypothetical protein